MIWKIDDAVPPGLTLATDTYTKKIGINHFTERRNGATTRYTYHKEKYRQHYQLPNISINLSSNTTPCPAPFR